MARSSTDDPVEKFRFRLTVIAVDLSINGVVNTVAGLLGKNPFALVTRAGFNQISIPKVTVSEINYRENIDNQRFSKSPGLSKYEPISLKRGVTKSRDLYNWYSLVNDETLLTGVAQELSVSSTQTPAQSENFRRDVIIDSLDREGNTIKSWYLFNAFPIVYKGGNDLDASIDEKLIEELDLTYEYFLEVGSAGFGAELASGALQAVAGAAIGFAASELKLPFTR